MADINAIADQIQGLTLLEASQLVKLLEEKLGVSAAAATVAAAPASGPAAAAPAAEEKTEFSVVLQAAGPNKDQCDQGCSRGHQPGPEGAKDLVDSAPKPVKEGVSRTKPRPSGRSCGRWRDCRGEIGLVSRPVRAGSGWSLSPQGHLTPPASLLHSWLGVFHTSVREPRILFLCLQSA